MITPVSKQRQNPSFGGYDPNKFYNRVTDRFTDTIARTIARAHSKNNPGAFVSWVNSHPKLNKYAHQAMLNLASFAYTVMLMTNTAKSKNIEKDRKPMLILNAALVTAISSVAALVIDKKTDGFLEKVKDAYTGVHKITNRLKIDQLESSLKKVKSITLFTFIVRLAIPLIMVPITGSIVKRGKAKQDAKKDAMDLEKFRQSNLKLMDDYDNLKALSAQVEKEQAPVKNNKAADKASKKTKIA